jgi:hypothetical protein
VRLCPNGHENPDDADFCVECGQPLRAEPAVEDLPPSQVAGAAAGAQAGVQPAPQVAAAEPAPPPAPAPPPVAAPSAPPGRPLSELSGREQLAHLLDRLRGDN